MMLTSTGKIRDMSSRAGDVRNTSRWQKLRREVIEQSGGICFHCGHLGAREADHLVPVEVDPSLALVRSNIVASHGSSRGAESRCWVCDPRRGRCCNQSRNRRRPRPAEEAECRLEHDRYGCTGRIIHAPGCRQRVDAREVW
jgi:hypothetical protein